MNALNFRKVPSVTTGGAPFFFYACAHDARGIYHYRVVRDRVTGDWTLSAGAGNGTAVGSHFTATRAMNAAQAHNAERA